MVQVTVTGLEPTPDVLTILPEVQWAIAAGTANALTASYIPTITALPDGFIVGVRAAFANTTTTPTFAVDGFTAYTITKEGGTALLAGDIAAAGHELLLRYRLASTRWELLNPAVSGAINDQRTITRSNTSSSAGANVATAQSWLGTVTLPVGSYTFEGWLFLNRSAGTTSHTTAVLFGGTATLGAIQYLAQCKTGDANDLQNVQMIRSAAATATVIKAASTSASEEVMVWVRGILTVTVAGTLIPQFQFSVAPGGVPSIGFGTTFSLKKVSNTADVTPTYGPWS